MKNAGLVFIAILMIFAGGFYSVANMKMESLPNVDIPYLNVSIVYPGATPEQVLRDVATPLEDQLSTVKDVKNLYVTSVANAAYATLEFEMSKSMDDAEKDINSALGKINLPDSAQKPEIRKEGPTSEAVLTFAVGGGGASQADVQQYVEEKIKPAVSGIEGVSKVEVDGSSEKKLYVKVNPDKLKEHNLSLDKIKQALLANNVSAPAGAVTLDDTTMNVQVGKQLNSIEDVKNVSLILVEQNMSGMTDAFKSIGDGMGQLGQAVGGVGQGVGNLTKGQMLMQQEIQLMAAVNGLYMQLMQDQSQLSSLQAELAKQTDQAAWSQTAQQIQLLQAKMKGEQDKITELQGNIGKLQEMITATGEEQQKLLQGLQAQQSGAAPSQPSADSAQVALNISSLKLSDVADVTYEAGGAGSYTRLNGKPAVVAGVYPAIGANTVEVVKVAQEKLDELKLPNGYAVTKLRDDSVEIKKSVNSMLREAVFGALLAALVTLAFLRNLRSTLVALMSIPLSILVTMIVMRWMDYSLNMLTLAGVAVAVGRVVDDSIVVIENIYRRIQHSSPEQRDSNLVLTATREVAAAITSSTVTTIAVFGPLAFVPGIVGKFFAPFAWSVVIALAFSLLIAVTVVPLMSRLFLMNLQPVEHKETVIQRGYKKLLVWSLGHKALVVVVCLALLGGTGVLAMDIPMNFFPQEKTTSYSFTADMPLGTSLEKTNDVALKVEQVVAGTNAVENYNTTVRPGSLRTRIVLKEGADTAAFEKALREGTKNLGEGVTPALKGLGGVTGGGGLLMIVNGPDIETIKEGATDLKKAVESVPGLADVTTNIEGVRPQVTITVDDAKASAKGVNPAMVMGAVRDLISGSTVTNVQIGGKTTELNLGLAVSELDSLAKIGEQTVSNMAGEQVAIKDIATVERKTGATSITRLNKLEYVSINAKILDSNTSGVQAQVDDAVAKVKLPDGVSYYFEGESKAMADGFKNMAIAIGVSVVLVYVVMMVAFGEMLAPLAILFSLPFIFVGAIAGLYLTGESLGMPAMVGVLMLIGIVVTNAIVLIDRVMQNRAQGMDTMESLVEAGTTRIRPILMTAVATIGALIPLAISSEGGIISRSLAIVVISGLSTSTLLTLVIVPIAYTVLENMRRALFGKKERATSLVTGETREA